MTIGVKTVAFVVGGSVVVKIVKAVVSNSVVPDVAVLSDGSVIVSNSGVEVEMVMGTKTVAFVVGGSVVVKIVNSPVLTTVVEVNAVRFLGMMIVWYTGILVN